MSISTHQLETKDEEALIRQAITGSRDAFALLVRSHQAAVRWQLSRSLRNPAAVDDVAQEVFLHAYQNLASYRGAGSLRSWLSGIARNKAKQFIRTDIRRKERETGALAVQLAKWRLDRLEANSGHGDEFEQTIQTLRECIKALAPKSRRVLEDHYFRSQTLESLGEQQGRSGGAVRMMLFRIRKALGECIREKLPGEV